MATQNPLADRRVRSLLGLSSGLIVAAVGIIFLDPPLQWAFVAFGVFDAIATPYMLGLAVEEETASEQSGFER